MNFLILASWFLLCATPIKPPPPAEAGLKFSITDLRRTGASAEFTLDFGSFEIRKVQARLEGEPAAIRLPATVLRSGRSEPELDFLSPELEKKISEVLRHPGENRGPGLTWSAAAETKIHIARLEPIESKKGSRLAEGELWIAGALTVKVSLMKSKWSAAPESAWVAFPSVWLKESKRYEDLLVIKDKAFKKKIRETLIKAYLERWAGKPLGAVPGSEHDEGAFAPR